MEKLVPLINLITLEFENWFVRVLVVVPVNSGAYLAAYVWEIVKDSMYMLLLNSVSMTCYCRNINKIASFVIYDVVVSD